MDVAGKRVVVVGLARSGIAAAGFLASRGARVVATDRKPEGELEAGALSLRGKGVELELGAHRAETFTGADTVVVSPGVPWDLRELAAARGRGVPVMAELELGFRFLPRSGGGGDGHQGQVDDDGGAGRDAAARWGATCAWAATSDRPVTGLVDGATDASRTSCWRCRASSWRAPTPSGRTSPCS